MDRIGGRPALQRGLVEKNVADKPIASEQRTGRTVEQEDHEPGSLIQQVFNTGR